jgi:hypothetical protein
VTVIHSTTPKADKSEHIFGNCYKSNQFCRKNGGADVKGSQKGENGY